MTKPSLAIRVDNPCSQQWAEMTPTENGRFCNNCSKHIIDFTTLTDNEILKVITDHPTGFCGQFRADQLNRKIVETRLNPSRKGLNVFIAGLMVAIGAGSVSAQSAPSSTVQTQTIDEKNPTGAVCARTAVGDTIEQTITVIVSDTVKDKYVQGVIVFIPGTNIGATTDSTGKATLTIKKYVKGDSIRIRTSAPRYAMARANILPSSATVTVEIDLSSNSIPYTYLGEGRVYFPEEEKTENKNSGK